MPTSADEVGAHWLLHGAATGVSHLHLQAAVGEGLVAAGQTGLAFHLLAQPLCLSLPGLQMNSPARRAQAISVLARMATDHLAPRDAEPNPDLPQAVVDGAQSALWILRSDRRHWTVAQRLLLLRTEALRRQVASGARELRYAALPTTTSVLQALDRSVTWLQLMSLGDVAALSLAPKAPEQPLPPGWEDGEEA
jgi:hypothetical protein